MLGKTHSETDQRIAAVPSFNGRGCRRIFVTGNAGSGKSTYAKRLGETLNLPVHGLDAIVWQSGWRKTPPEEKQKRIQPLAACP